MTPSLDQQGQIRDKAPTGAESMTGLPPWLDALLVCPACREPVVKVPQSYRCGSCARDFPVRHGVPDFRLLPDPYISVEDELVKIARLLSGSPKTFVELLEAYYNLSPENPPVLNRHYVSAMQAAVKRGCGILSRLRADAVTDDPSRILLDVGCGTAGLLAASPPFFPRAVGVDVALRWLLIGRQRLAESGVSVPLICANAESLPFAPSSFDAVSADAVLEHVRDPATMRDETLRVLQPHGRFLFTTNNRFSMLPEPHLRILGFGLLPRSVMEWVAMRVRRTPYRARLLSLREIVALFRHVAKVTLPVYEAGELGPNHETIRRAWHRAHRYRGVRALVWPVAPQYMISGPER